MLHAGILGTTSEGAALCFRAFCQEGFVDLGPHDHPDVTLDCIALARSLAAWGRSDYQAVRANLALSVGRLAAAGAQFFACPDNTSHIALEQPGPDLALPGLHIARVVTELTNGAFTERSRQEVIRISGALRARGCDAVALVCTEIPLLVPRGSWPLPALDSTRLLARAAFEVAIGQRPLPAWRGGPSGSGGGDGG